MSAATPPDPADPLGSVDTDRLFEELLAATPGMVPDAAPAAVAAPGPVADAARAAPEVVPFALGAASTRPQQKLAGLERMGEKLARGLRTVIEPLVQTRAQVLPLPVEVRRFDDWAGELPYFMSLSHYRLRPLQGGMMIAIHPDFVTSLIERFYGGGSANARGQRRPEFTAGEDLLLGRLMEKTVGLLAELWREITPVDAVLVARETSMAHIAFCRPADAVAIQSFSIQPADGEAHTLTIVYPLGMLRPVEEQMATRIHNDDPSGAEEWQRALTAALEEVTLPVRSVLARPEISLSQLMALKAGDVIPIQLRRAPPLLVSSRPIAEGTMGEQDGRAALLIERVGLH